MIIVEIPGRPEPLEIRHIVLDYNGTIARDGQLLDEAAQRIVKLAQHVPVYVLTADTYGNVVRQCQDLPVTVKTFPQANAALCKERIVKELGAGVCAIGNGFNDIPMFDASVLSIAVMEHEGVCAQLITHADILTTSPGDAMDLLLLPNRLRATLRN